MKNNKIFLSLYIGYCVYTLLLFYFGSSGIAVMKQSEIYRDKLADRIEQIRAANISLENQLFELSNDSEAVMLRSRSLGYFSGSDRIIRFEVGSSSRTPYKLETSLRMNVLTVENATMFRAAGVSVSMIVYILLMLFMRDQDDVERGRTRNYV